MIGEQSSKQWRKLQTAAGVTALTYVARAQKAQANIAKLAKK